MCIRDSLGAAGDDALPDVAAGDGTDAGHPEDLAHLGLAGDDLLEHRGEQSEHGRLEVLQQLVEDVYKRQPPESPRGRWAPTATARRT